MKKIIDFFKSQSKKAKDLFLSGLGIYIIYAIYTVRNTGYILEQRGLPTFLTVVSGEIIGILIVSIPVLLVSSIIAIIPYYIFRGIAREYKRYLDYVAIIFLVLSVIIIISGLRAQ